MNIQFEGINFDAEGISEYGSAKEFIAKDGKDHFFVGDADQEAKLTRIYDLCAEATNKGAATAPVKPNKKDKGGGE